jgi:tRNA nucleotidyltransferase (CCA-adding enzyme)
VGTGPLNRALLDRIPADVLQICRRLREAGKRAWIVGGCTRDLILGREVHDWDVATDARPGEVMDVFRRVIPTGVEHGTVTVMIGKKGYELTTLRGEGAYSDGRHPDSVLFVNDLTQDLARRDFTVNAIALDPLRGEWEDPFGGREDLAARLIRAVGEPVQRFSEDGLRLLRAARFVATLQFELEPKTRDAMGLALPTLRKVSGERVRDEILKTLMAPSPSRGFQLMLSTGLLEVVLPELIATVGCEQNHYHRFDVWTHTMQVLDACVAEPVLRLAALLHDVGKPASRQMSEKTGEATFYHHEVKGAQLAEAVCMRLRLSTEQRERVVSLVRLHLVVYDDTWTDAAVRRWVRRVGEQNVGAVLEIARADAHGKGVDGAQSLQALDALRERVQQLQAQGLAISVRQLAIDGHDLMEQLGIAAGPRVGHILRLLLEQVLETPEINQRDELLRRAKASLTEDEG